MNTQEILSIVALSLLGLCLLCGLAKMAMRGDSAKKNCDKACSMAVFAAVVLLAISQLIGETDGYCQIAAKDNQQGTKGCRVPDGFCGNMPGPGGLKCIMPGNLPQPKHLPCCPTVGSTTCGGTITGCSGDGCPPGSGTSSASAWWTNNCGPFATSPPSQ